MVLVCIAGGLEWASRWIERNIERSRVVTENGENYAIKAVAAARAADSLNCLINILWNLGLTKDNVDSAEMILKECINLSDRYGNNFMD